MEEMSAHMEDWLHFESEIRGRDVSTNGGLIALRSHGGGVYVRECPLSVMFNIIETWFYISPV